MRRLAGLLAAAALLAAAHPADAARPDGFDRARFAHPPGDSRPTSLWFWNGTVTPALVDAQLADLQAQGIDEVLVFPYDTPSLRPVFFSEPWFDLIEHTLREARRRGMHVWLFNDDFFPSGRGAGLIVNGGRVGDRVYPPRPDLRPDGGVAADGDRRRRPARRFRSGRGRRAARGGRPARRRRHRPRGRDPAARRRAVDGLRRRRDRARRARAPPG